MVPHERNWREFAPEQPHPDIPYQCASVPFAARGHHWQGPSCENGKTPLFRAALGLLAACSTWRNLRFQVYHLWL